MSESTWSWEKRAENGATVHYGTRDGYRAAEVTHNGPGWQATMRGTGTESSGYLDQRSGYYASPASAKSWAERYGRARKRQRRR